MFLTKTASKLLGNRAHSSLFTSGDLIFCLPNLAEVFSISYYTLPDKSSDISNLIIVPCNAVYIGKESSHIALDKYWRQGHAMGYPNEGPLYAEHADAGVIHANKIKDSLLIFSGGKTSISAGPLSEAQSYWFLEDQKNWLGTKGVKERTITEEYARDSYENLENSIFRFKSIELNI